jgi:hypothetical protein
MFLSLVASALGYGPRRKLRRQPFSSARLKCEQLEGRLCPSLLGPEIHVNTKMALDQYESANASAANGRHVVVWTDQGQAPLIDVFGGGKTVYIYSTAIKAQLYDANRAKVGGEIVVAPLGYFLQVSHPVVAMDGVGNFAVAWTEQAGSDSTTLNVKGARFSSDGTKLGTFSVASAADKQEFDPAIAMAANGNFVVSFTTTKPSDATDYDVRAKTYYADGTLNKSLTVAASGASESESRAAMAPDGRFAIAYRPNTYQSPDSGDVRLARYSAAGALLTDQGLDTPGLYAVSPDVAMDNDGNCVVVYRASDAAQTLYLKARRVSNTGVLGAEINVDQGVAGDRPAVALDPTNGKFVVAYSTTKFGLLKVREVSASNQVWATYTLGDFAKAPAISIDGNHHYLVTCTDDPSVSLDGGDGIYGQFGNLADIYFPPNIPLV